MRRGRAKLFLRRLFAGSMTCRRRVRAVRRVRRPETVRVRRLIAALIALALSAWFLCAVIESKAAPYIDEYAETIAHEYAVNAMNDAVAESAFSGAIRFEKNAAGEISAVSTDLALVNSVRSEICGRVLELIEKYNSDGAEIPLGTILGGELLNGRGPRVRLKLVPLGRVSADYVSDFRSAGINQTRCRLLLRLTVSLRVMLSGRVLETSASTDVPIAETIVVGNVPDTYTVVDGAKPDDYGIIID